MNMYSLTRTGALLILGLLCATSKADDLDDKLREYMLFNMIPGMSVGISIDGKHQFRNYGLANIEHQAKVNKDSIFRLASLSKQFIAAEILLLQQDGKLQVSDLVSKYLPDCPDAWKSITISQLLSHTSGLERDSENFDDTKPEPLMTWVKGSHNAKLLSEPGTQYSYSNQGYVLLGAIIERVSGQSWGSFGRSRIFEPAGMASTFAVDPFRIVPNRVIGYGLAEDSEVWRNIPSVYAFRPSGGFESSITDLLRWDSCLDGEKILSKASKDQMWSEVLTRDGKGVGYGFGWELGEHRGIPLTWHGGVTSGFTSYWVRIKSRKTSIVVLTNSRGYALNGILPLFDESVLKLGKAESYPTVESPDQSRIQLVRRYFETRVNGTPDSSVVSQNIVKMAQAMPTAWKLGAVRLSRFGRLLSITEVKVPVVSQDITNSYIIKYDKITFRVNANFAGGKVNTVQMFYPI